MVALLKEKNVTLQGGIDTHIMQLIAQVNQHPDFLTTLSCGGHIQTCTPKLGNVMRIRAVDDTFYGDDDTIDSVLQDCDLDGWICESQPPFLQFLCRNKEKYRAFFKHLHAFVDVKPNVVARFNKGGGGGGEYSYSYHPVESYTTAAMLEDRMSPYVGFAMFWKHFVTAWNSHVDASATFTPIESFPAHSKCKCRVHLGQVTTPTSPTHKNGFCAIDLFGDRSTDQWIGIMMNDGDGDHFD